MQSDDVGEKQVYPLLAIPEQITEGRSSGCVVTLVNRVVILDE